MEILNNLRAILLLFKNKTSSQVKSGTRLREIEGEELLSFAFNEIAFTQAHFIIIKCQRPPFPL